MNGYNYTGRNAPAVYNRYGMPTYLGQNFDIQNLLQDKAFLTTSALIVAGTITALIVFRNLRKRRKK